MYIKKTTNNEVFKKYSLVVAINNKKCIASELYQNGTVNSERFNDFLKKICSKVRGKLFVLDNEQIIKESTKTNNKRKRKLFTLYLSLSSKIE